MNNKVRAVAIIDIALLAVAGLLGGLTIGTAPGPHAQVEKVAASMGVTIKWTKDTPCGTATTCYAYTSPNVVYVDPQTGDPDHAAAFVLAEVIQHKSGMEADTCQAVKIERAVFPNLAAAINYCK
jgi:hypothetical protein